MDLYPTNIAHDSGFQSYKSSATGLQAVNPESHDLRPSPEIQREMGDNNYDGTSFLQLLEPHLASTGKPPDVDPSQVGTEYSLKGKLLENRLLKNQEPAYLSTATSWTLMMPYYQFNGNISAGYAFFLA
jgi:hypothetical protein